MITYKVKGSNEKVVYEGADQYMAYNLAKSNFDEHLYLTGWSEKYFVYIQTYIDGKFWESTVLHKFDPSYDIEKFKKMSK